jgi:hypothetical protein
MKLKLQGMMTQANYHCFMTKILRVHYFSSDELGEERNKGFLRTEKHRPNPKTKNDTVSSK